MQTKRMDVIVLFWSECEGQVITKYLGSVFTYMGHLTVDDLVDNFEGTLSKLGMLNLVQVRPNVNWLFYDI